MAAVEVFFPEHLLAFDRTNAVTGEVDNRFNRDCGLPHDEFLARWACMHLEHPGIAYLVDGGKEQVFSVTDIVSQRQFEETAFFAEIFKPMALSAQIAAVIPVEGHIVGITINRDTPFTQDDKAAVELLHPHIIQAHFRAMTLDAQPAAGLEIDFSIWRNHGLTRRECEALQWVVEGKRNAEIAIILGMQRRTVGKHVERILAKLGVETRTAAATRAVELLHGR